MRMCVAMSVLSAMLVGLRHGQSPLIDRTVTAEGASIHIRCGGERHDLPLVVLEAGAGGGVETWQPVHAAIARFVRVCAYDRPGTPTSGPEPQGLTAANFSAFLRNMLKTAGELPPYVLVGHSFGGIVASLYAVTYPSDVVGLVLVDSSHEDQMQRMARIAGPPPAPPGAPPPGAGPPPAPGLRFRDFADRLRATPFKRDIPLVVLTAGRPAPDPMSEKLAPLWLELQRDLASRSARSSHVVLKDAGHLIPRDDPQAVIDAVRRIVGQRQ